MIKASIVVPAYKRVEQTVKSLNLIFSSKGLNTDFQIEVIVADSTPDDTLQTALSKNFKDKIIYVKPQKKGVASNKNTGAKTASNNIIIFSDSDIEVEKDSILNTIKALQNNPTAGAITGQVFWRGGEKDGRLDRPREEDRKLVLNGSNYIEAIYSRYIATYKTVFLGVGVYDDEVFNFRGEGSDLSIRYWREGFPLAFESSIKVHHVYDAVDSIALRTVHPEWGVAKDLLLLAYKYKMLDSDYPNFSHTVNVNFQSFGEEALCRFLQGIGNNFELIVKSKQIMDKFRSEDKPKYDFKFLEVFSERNLLEKCLKNAQSLLVETRKNAFT